MQQFNYCADKDATRWEFYGLWRRSLDAMSSGGAVKFVSKIQISFHPFRRQSCLPILFSLGVIPINKSVKGIESMATAGEARKMIYNRVDQ